MELALAPVHRDLRSFRLAQPVAQASSRVEFTACTLLTLAATGIWLFLLPIELLRLAAA